MNSSLKKRVLVSAYACSPIRGSEPGVGWGFINSICDDYDLDVIVEEEKFRTEIEHWIQTNSGHPATKIRFHFLKKRRNRLLRKIWPPSYYWYYRQWHSDAARLAVKLDQDRNFDLMHQLTMVGFREPGFLWKLDKPFVWGPIGGAGFFPWKFLGKIGLLGGVYFACYNVYNYCQLRCSYRPRKAAQRAQGGLIAATDENRQAASYYWDKSAQVISEVGLSGFSNDCIIGRKTDEPLRILWTGQIVPRKALNLALEALADLPANCRWELHVLGTGPLEGRMRALAHRFGISPRCYFHGWVDRQQVLKIASEMHVALVTSLRDLTSTVVVEALETGLPVIAPSHCGFVDALNETCGILVPSDNPKAMRTGIAQAIAGLEQNETRRLELAKGARAQAECFDWKLKGKALKEIYEARLAEEGSKR